MLYIRTVILMSSCFKPLICESVSKATSLLKGLVNCWPGADLPHSSTVQDISESLYLPLQNC